MLDIHDLCLRKDPYRAIPADTEPRFLRSHLKDHDPHLVDFYDKHKRYWKHVLTQIRSFWTQVSVEKRVKTNITCNNDYNWN